MQILIRVELTLEVDYAEKVCESHFEDWNQENNMSEMIFVNIDDFIHQFPNLPITDGLKVWKAIKADQNQISLEPENPASSNKTHTHDF